MWKNEKPSLVILDSQAVKNTDNASETGWCHHKCTNGIKRHILVDVTWIPISILVTTANVNDRVWGKMLCKKDKAILQWIKNMLVDWWYSWKWFKISIKKTTWITVIIAPKPTRKKWDWFKPEHKRRIVERSNAWMDKCRRLQKNNERYLENSATMAKICFIRICLNRLSKTN
jgi:transposase